MEVTKNNNNKNVLVYIYWVSMFMFNTFYVPRKQSLLLASLLIVMLISSLLVYTSINDANGASSENAIHVKNEDELRKAINNAPTGQSTTITLDNDITLTNTTDDSNSNYWPVNIIIPADKDITLTSSKVNGYYKLNGAVNGSILFIASNGTLRIDDIAVIHTSNTGGGGVDVYAFAKFYFYNGIISGNKIYGGSGVSNTGTFVMSGGEISGNAANNGGGVYNSGYATFTMSGGKISGNTATSNGGGVLNSGTFTMSGGTISGNTATSNGGGVCNINAMMVTSDDVIKEATFTMSGGKISGNTAKTGGGVYISNTGFNRQGGTISGNTATDSCNDVYPDGSGDGLSDGNNGSSNGNNGSNGNDGSSIDGYSLRDIVITCGITGVVVLCIVLVVLRISSQKRLNK